MIDYIQKWQKILKTNHFIVFRRVRELILHFPVPVFMPAPPVGLAIDSKLKSPSFSFVQLDRYSYFPQIVIQSICYYNMLFQV